MEDYITRYKKYKEDLKRNMGLYLTRITNSILDATDNISDDDLTKMLIKYPKDSKSILWQVSGKMHFYVGCSDNLGEYDYDSRPFSEVRKFLKKYYNGITLQSYGFINPEDRFVLINFSYDVKYEETDFLEYKPGHFVLSTDKNYKNMMLFAEELIKDLNCIATVRTIERKGTLANFKRVKDTVIVPDLYETEVITVKLKI